MSKSIIELRGKPCWGLSWDRYLNLSMSFGDPILEIREPIESKSKLKHVRDLFARRLVTVQGRWWLWLRMAQWRIELNGTQLADGACSYRRIQIAMAKLKGQILTSVTIDAKTAATRFEFDLGGVLTVYRYRRFADDELWSLYKPKGYVLSVLGDGTYEHGLGSKMPGMKRKALPDGFEVCFKKKSRKKIE
ncbi:MAG: hypothetical protein WCT04_03825 [Planctomycetota bacterium]